MPKTISAAISATGQVTLLEPLVLEMPHRALVTILEPLPQQKVNSKYAGAFASGRSDTSESVDAILADGFGE
jgi:hypothetical protein